MKRKQIMKMKNKHIKNELSEQIADNAKTLINEVSNSIFDVRVKIDMHGPTEIVLIDEREVGTVYKVGLQVWSFEPWGLKWWMGDITSILEKVYLGPCPNCAKTKHNSRWTCGSDHCRDHCGNGAAGGYISI
jgi:hypothetical protein